MQKSIQTIEAKSQGKAVRIKRARSNDRDKARHRKDLDIYSFQKQAGDGQI
jgi:hypothetical protein